MITPQFSLDLNAELIVDNFAGGGGASTGIEWATGRHVNHAINHDRHALGMHRINHPQTVHHCEDVFDVDPEAICDGRPVGLAHFSPDCKDFSKAKGGQPLDKRIRGLVLVMLRWAKYRARVMTMENVEEITGWGPLKRIKKKGKWGWYRDPELKGRTWLAFLDILSTGIRPDHPDLPEILAVLGGTVTEAECVRGFGYMYEGRQIRACVHGSPTIRNRFYLVARCDGRPIVWPAATHTDPRTPGLGLKPYRIIADCIDWERPCPSIFLTKKQARARKINCKRPLAKASLRRIALGIDRFVLKAKEPFLVNLTHQGANARVESIREPIRTITGANRGEKALVAPSLSRFNGSHEGRGDGAARNYSTQECLGTLDTSNRYGLTEATLAPTVVNTANSKTTGRGPNTWPVEEPARTVTAAPGFGLAAATLAPLITECANASSQRTMAADEPMRTACGEVKGGHFAAVSASLMVNTTGHPGAPADTPGPTITTGGQQTVVAAGMLKMRGSPETHPPGQSPEEPLHTVSTARNHGVIAAHLTKFVTGSTGSAVTQPGPTVCAGTHRPETHGGAGSTHGAVAAFLAQHNGGYNETPGHEATEPVSAISSRGSQQQLVAAHVETYYGSGSIGQSANDPARTSTARDRLGIVDSFLACTMTREQLAGARRVAKFLRAFGVVFEGEFATIEGFILVDIGMRMLTPRELFRAQGFGENHVIDRALVVDSATGEVTHVWLTKEQQIRMCGNSVCPHVMAALVRANTPELALYGQKALTRALTEII